MKQLTEEQKFTLDTIKAIEENVHTNEYKVDLRELDLVAGFRSGKLTIEQVDEQLGDLALIQIDEGWAELQEEYKDDAETLRFMKDYGYVPFSFELEEWREETDYPFDEAQKQQFISERVEQ